MSSTSSTSIVAQKKEAAISTTCPLCCEAEIDICLSLCSHECCKACIAKWIEKAEASGHQERPTCPFCRLELAQDETTTILGRPFQPATPNNAVQVSLENAVVEDDLTLQWLQEQTRPCPHCGALIEKEEGCDLMECLCGYRFCYGCGSPGAQCSCTPDNHVFYDNVLGRNAGRAARAEEAPTNEETGLVDLQAHIERRRTQDRIRRQRETRFHREVCERRMVDEVTLSAKWLFCTSREHSLCILQKQVQMKTVQQRREIQRSRRHRAQMRVHPIVSSGAWLFRVNHSGVAGVLRQLERAEDVRALRMREEKKRQREHGDGESEGADAVLDYGRWLFQKHGRAETLRVLARLMEERQKTRRRRGRNFDRVYGALFAFCSRPGCPNCRGRTNREDRDARENAINIRLLFLNDQEKTSELEEIERDWQ